MLTDIHDFYHAFMEGLMGYNKAWKFMRKAELWRFADAQRLGRMYRMELDRLRRDRELNIEAMRGISSENNLLMAEVAWLRDALDGERRMKQFYREAMEKEVKP